MTVPFDTQRLAAPLIISGFSSQLYAKRIAAHLGSTIVGIARKQFRDKEIQTTIEHNVRGRNVVVIASGSGDPNKQEKEARLLMRAVQRAAAKRVTLVLPYMWYGRSDDNWDERNSPALVDTIETLRAHCHDVVVVDPHNPGLTREKFIDMGSPVRSAVMAHFAFPFAVQLKHMINAGAIAKDRLILAHADAGSTKRISRSFRTCLYSELGFDERNPDQDDWPQGLKDRDKATGLITIKGFSSDVAGKDVVIFEDMIESGGTSCQLARFLKKIGVRSVTFMVTSGLFTANAGKGEPITASIDRINASDIDAIFITDTFDNRLTDPQIAAAIEASPIIHEIDTAAYMALIIRALSLDIGEETDLSLNSVSAILRGIHPKQIQGDQRIARPTPLKPGAYRKCPGAVSSAHEPSA
jgi:ribose-phosphate pyrophosphokinase